MKFVNLAIENYSRKYNHIKWKLISWQKLWRSFFRHCISVSEIKGALGARRAHFRGRAHVFRTCAPDVHTFFHSIIIAICQRSA